MARTKAVARKINPKKSPLSADNIIKEIEDYRQKKQIDEEFMEIDSTNDSDKEEETKVNDDNEESLKSKSPKVTKTVTKKTTKRVKISVPYNRGRSILLSTRDNGKIVRKISSITHEKTKFRKLVISDYKKNVKGDLTQCKYDGSTGSMTISHSDFQIIVDNLNTITSWNNPENNNVIENKTIQLSQLQQRVDTKIMYTLVNDIGHIRICYFKADDDQPSKGITLSYPEFKIIQDNFATIQTWENLEAMPEPSFDQNEKEVEEKKVEENKEQSEEKIVDEINTIKQ